jgi:hypothetical protein
MNYTRVELIQDLDLKLFETTWRQCLKDLEQDIIISLATPLRDLHDNLLNYFDDLK